MTRDHRGLVISANRTNGIALDFTIYSETVQSGCGLSKSQIIKADGASRAALQWFNKHPKKNIIMVTGPAHPASSDAGKDCLWVFKRTDFGNPRALRITELENI